MVKALQKKMGKTKREEVLLVNKKITGIEIVKVVVVVRVLARRWSIDLHTLA